MSAPYTLRGPLDRMVAARRLAAGLSIEAVARAAKRPVEQLRELQWEPGFSELVDGWAELMAREQVARHRRLLQLAQAVLEDGVNAGDSRVAIFVIREDLRKRQATETLARSVGRLIARDLARAETEAEAAAGEPEPGAEDSAPEVAAGEPAPAERKAARAPVDPADRMVWQAGAYLRRRMIEEHLLWCMDARHAERERRRAGVPEVAPAEPEPEGRRPDPAAMAALFGDAASGAPVLAPESPLRHTLLAAKVFGLILSQTPEPTPAFEESLSAALVRLPREKLDILATFSPAAMARLLRMADGLPEAAGATPTAAMPEGP
jgi:hypothetical protein